ncbi:uncharacterized protein LOC141749666 [Larus michahellis]|uniref:uncharacterized protein LOC141749666 n=1 Tax=Larus michahellis TaxID=119627 RepID=UPI003D9BE65F
MMIEPTVSAVPWANDAKKSRQKWEKVKETAPNYLREVLHKGPSIINEATNISPENKVLQLPAEIEDLRSTVTKPNSGVSSYFLTLKETLRLQNKNTSSVIDEMLCLLKAEKEHKNGNISRPLHIKNQSCAYENAKNFIKELKKMTKWECMKQVEKDMKELQNTCPILRKPPHTDCRCSEMEETNFSRFKKNLEEFLKWVNEEQDCSNIMSSESGLYLDGKCSCSDLWKYRKGLL